MRLEQRLLAVFICVLVALPFTTALALTEADDRYKMQEEILNASFEVSVHSAEGIEMKNIKGNSKKDINETEVELRRLAREKRAIRLQLSSALKNEKIILEHGIDPHDSDAVLNIFEDELQDSNGFLRSLYLAQESQSVVALQTMLGQISGIDTLAERTEKSIRLNAILQSRKDLLSLLKVAHGLPDTLDTLRDQHEDLLVEYFVMQDKNDLAEQRLHSSASKQNEIERTVYEVQSRISQMQSELARIDARVRRRAERVLIEKGLLSPKEGEYSGGKIVGSAATISWPAYARISAGYYDAGYQKFFGFPHKGIDIAVPQGSPVTVAADGVVYAARHGGAKGYSYVLIGHQGGTATLYGHLSKINVVAGQDVSRGQMLGLSGGTPGTVGAGPMTTGAHLHFEVIQNGKHINPISVLP